MELLPVFPEQEMNHLIQSLLNHSPKVRAEVIPSLIALTKAQGQKTTIKDLTTLIDDPEPEVVVSLVKNIH